MSLNFSEENTSMIDPLEVVEQALVTAGWQFERDEDDSVQCIAPSRWGEMGALFALRDEPAAIHFSVTLDVKPQAGRKATIFELIMMMNERLWLGHFDYWVDENVILYRQAIPMTDRDEPSQGEVRAILAAALDSIERLVPAFNFCIWAGKTPREALQATLFETQGEA